MERPSTTILLSFSIWPLDLEEDRRRAEARERDHPPSWKVTTRVVTSTAEISSATTTVGALICSRIAVNLTFIMLNLITASQGIIIDASLSVRGIDLYSVSEICKYVMEVITKDRLEFSLQVALKFDGESDEILLGIAELCKLFPRMAAKTFHQAFVSIQAHVRHGSSSHQNKLGRFSVTMSSRSLAIRTEVYDETVLTLLRRGESVRNEKNMFTGCVVVALTEKGMEVAIEVGKRIFNTPVDEIYTSSLICAQMTAVIAINRHLCKKVPIIPHNEGEQTKTWSEIHSEEARYGDLQGFDKQETAER